MSLGDPYRHGRQPFASPLRWLLIGVVVDVAGLAAGWTPWPILVTWPSKWRRPSPTLTPVYELI